MIFENVHRVLENKSLAQLKLLQSQIVVKLHPYIYISCITTIFNTKDSILLQTILLLKLGNPKIKKIFSNVR